MATSADTVVDCDPCQNRKAVSFCTECREFYCTECSSLHQTLKVTAKHIQVYISSQDQNLTATGQCGQCRECNITQSTMTVCVECRELYCDKCSKYHGKIKATRHHMIFQLYDEKRSDTSDVFQQLRISSPKPDFSGAQVRKDTVVDKSPTKVQVKYVDVSDTSIRVTFSKKFSPRIPSDIKKGSLEVQRMLILPDDRVVVLDSENEKLKLFSADYQIIHHCAVDIYTGLTLVDDTTVAVSGGNTITLYTVHTDRIQKSTSMKCDGMNGDVYDICFIDNKFVCLAYQDDNKWSIDVVDMEGDSETIFTENSTLCISNHIITGDNNCFYINTSAGEVRCLTLGGRQLWAVPVTCDGMTLVRGRLLVVGYGTGDVHQISRDGKLHDQPVLQGLHTPYCICYQQKRNRILLSKLKSRSRIKVYQVDYIVQFNTINSVYFSILSIPLMVTFLQQF